MKRPSLASGLGLLMLVSACQGEPANEVVLLVGRDVNPAWATVYEPELAMPGRQIVVVDVAGQPPAKALSAYLQPDGPRVIAVPLVLSDADPVVIALRALARDHERLHVVPPPEDDETTGLLIAQRALKMSQNRAQEGLFIVMDLPPGAEPDEIQKSANRVANRVAKTVDFQPITGIVWEGEDTATVMKKMAEKMTKPMVITYSTAPGPLTQELRSHLQGLRYSFDADSVLSDTNYRAWLRAAVGKATISEATP